MGGETEQQISSWTVDSLKQHLEQRINALETRLQERADAQDKAISKAESQMEKRLDALNELRGVVSDQASKFLTKETYEVAHEALDGKVDIVQNLITGIVAEKRGSTDRVNGIYALAGFVSVLLVIGTVLAANGVFK